jgi:hypothetical protein
MSIFYNEYMIKCKWHDNKHQGYILHDIRTYNRGQDIHKMQHEGRRCLPTPHP